MLRVNTTPTSLDVAIRAHNSRSDVAMHATATTRTNTYVMLTAHCTTGALGSQQSPVYHLYRWNASVYCFSRCCFAFLNDALLDTTGDQFRCPVSDVALRATVSSNPGVAKRVLLSQYFQMLSYIHFY